MLRIISYFLLLLTVTSCGYSRYVTETPPPVSYVPSQVALNFIVPPPLLIQENKFKTMSRPVSQYFEIAIPPCVDMTGKSDHLRNSLSDIFYTALFETKRFSLLDRGEINKIQQTVSFDKNVTTVDTTRKTTTYMVDKQIINREQELKQLENNSYQELLKKLKEVTDGLMLIYITSDSKTENTDDGKIGIDYRIVSGSTNQVLFAGSKEIKYTFNQRTSSLSFDRLDVGSVADSIRKKFPNPDFQEGLKIIGRRGDVITVNAGKNSNIIAGMIGYVVRVEKTLNNENMMLYRARFIVNEVFPESFNAKLIADSGGFKEEDGAIINTILVDEPIKMK